MRIRVANIRKSFSAKELQEVAATYGVTLNDDEIEKFRTLEHHEILKEIEKKSNTPV